jgi:serine/threonine protein phosphatase PrpC
MDFCGISDKGKVRQGNQDVCLTFYDDIKKTAILVVCDGMGGAKAGNVASSVAADTFMDYMQGRLSDDNTIIDIAQHMKDAVTAANSAVYQKSISDPECSGMGTTLVAATVVNSGAVIANVGDSRAYHITTGKMTQITKDHSVVEDMIDRGDLTRSEAKSHPNKNLITRALGTANDIEPDLFLLNLHSGEHLLLCSDGLSNVVPEQTILNEILRGPTASEVCDRLLRLSIMHGAPDNVTAALLKK